MKRNQTTVISVLLTLYFTKSALISVVAVPVSTTAYTFTDTTLDYNGTTLYETTSVYPSTSDSSTTEPSTDERPWVIITISAAVVLILIAVTSAITVLIIFCCCSTEKLKCVSPCCVGCRKQPARPPRPPDLHEVDEMRRSKGSLKSGATSEIRTETLPTDTQPVDSIAPSYENSGMVGTDGRARPNTYRELGEQDIYNNIDPKTEDIEGARNAKTEPIEGTREDSIYHTDEEPDPPPQDLYVNDQEAAELQRIATTKPEHNDYPEQELYVNGPTEVNVLKRLATTKMGNNSSPTNITPDANVTEADGDEQQICANQDLAADQEGTEQDIYANSDIIRQNTTMPSLLDKPEDDESQASGGQTPTRRDRIGGYKENRKGLTLSGPFMNQEVVDKHFTVDIETSSNGDSQVDTKSNLSQVKPKLPNKPTRPPKASKPSIPVKADQQPKQSSPNSTDDNVYTENDRPQTEANTQEIYLDMSKGKCHENGAFEGDVDKTPVYQNYNELAIANAK